MTVTWWPRAGGERVLQASKPLRTNCGLINASQIVVPVGSRLSLIQAYVRLEGRFADVNRSFLMAAFLEEPI